MVCVRNVDVRERDRYEGVCLPGGGKYAVCWSVHGSNGVFTAFLGLIKGLKTSKYCYLLE